MNGLTVNKAFEKYADELKAYKCTRKIAGGVVLHIAPLGDTDVWVATLTAYDKRGLKSEDAIPFRQFIKLINELETTLDKFHHEVAFTGCVVGWSPTEKVRDFLYSKKVHRAFFLVEEQLTRFLRDFTEKQDERETDVIILVG